MVAGVRMGPDSLVLAMKTTFQPEKAAGLEASYELRLGEIPYEIRVTGGGFEAERGEARHPEARIQADPDSVASVVFRARSLADAVREGEVELEGSRRPSTPSFARSPSSTPAGPGRRRGGRGGVITSRWTT